MQVSDKPLKFELYGHHKTIGIIILMLVVVRIINRFLTPIASYDDLPLWQKKIAKMTHYLMYCMMLAVPFSGWLMSCYAGYYPIIPGWGSVVLPLEKSTLLAGFFNTLHSALNYFLIALLLLHVAAVIFHSFYLKDKIITRMWFVKTRN